MTDSLRMVLELGVFPAQLAQVSILHRVYLLDSHSGCLYCEKGPCSFQTTNQKRSHMRLSVLFFFGLSSSLRPIAGMQDMGVSQKGGLPGKTQTQIKQACGACRRRRLQRPMCPGQWVEARGAIPESWLLEFQAGTAQGSPADPT